MEFIKFMDEPRVRNLPRWIHDWLWKLPPLPPYAGPQNDVYWDLALCLNKAMKRRHSGDGE